MTNVVRFQTGALEIPREQELPGLTKPALLVYEGTFMSMDGEVVVERADLMRLVENHNAYIKQLCEVEGCEPGDLPRRKYPPVQLDHSNSAKDTVGRLVGTISLGPYVREDGIEVLGVFGTVLLLGEENIEKALDGRWTNLSVGVDFKEGKFSELTITPFPAASEASLLSEKHLSEVKHKGYTIKTVKRGLDFSVVAIVSKNGKVVASFGEYSTPDQAISRAKHAIDNAELSGSDGKSSFQQSDSAAKRLADISFEHKGHKIEMTTVASGVHEVVVDGKSIGQVIGSPQRAVQVAKSLINQGALNPQKKKMSAMEEELMKLGRTFSYRGCKITIDNAQGVTTYVVSGPGITPQRYNESISVATAMEKARNIIDGWYADDLLSAKSVKFSKGETMDKDKLKKYLMDEKKMSAEEADKKLSEDSEEELSKLAAEADEHEKKMAAGDVDKMSSEEDDEEKKLAAGDVDKMSDKQDEKMKQAKMSAARATLTKLSTDFRKHTEGAQLAARKGQIVTRLSRLKASAKITPAEIKKIDVEKLSAKGQEVIDEVLATYENREPVVMVGQFGSMKAEELHKLTKQSQLSQLEAETRANMSLLRKTAPKSNTRLAEGEKEVEMAGYDVDTAMSEIEKLMDEGKTKEAMKKMRECMKRAKMSGHETDDSKMSSEETEKQLSSLAESVNKMQAQFEELHKLAGSLVGLG